MPQSRLEKRPKGLSHPKPGTNDSDHTPEPHHPRRPDDDGANTIQRLTPHQRLLRSATPPPLNTPLPDPSPMQISDSPPQHNRPSSATPPPTGRDDHSLAPSAARPDAPPRNVDDASTTPAQHPKAPRPYAPQIAETRDDNTAAVAAQQAYPTAVSYVHAPPHDAINAHYMHAPPPTHAHAHAHAYAWHPAQQQCQNAALHHQSHHQVAHRAYAYPVHHSMMQPLSHVPLAQFGHIQPSIWSPLHPHLHRHHHPGNPAPYPAPVPMQVQDVQQAHFTHYFQAQPPPVPNTNAHSLPPNNFEGQGSGRSHHTSTRYGVQRAPAADANIEKAARFVPNMSAGEGPQSLENVAETRVTKATVQNNQEKRDDFGRQPAPADQFQARGSSSMRNQDGKKPSAPPDIQEQVQKLDGKDNSASNKAPSSRHQAGSSKRPRDKQGAQPIRKSRKPYTITKNRENWSEKEHLLFVEALQLYNRDWKRIEAHIGTKTVLQIRSHAQKHFGKVTKYKTGEYIPPARPKRRASQPYPRSRGTANAKGSTSNGDPGKAKSRQDRNTVTTGSAIVSDSGAGSSDNGNVSANGGGNGKSISGGSSDGGRNGVSERPPSRQRSVDRCSDSLPPVKREQNAGSQNSAQDNPASNCNQPKSDVPSASGSFDAGTSPPVACLNMPVRPAPLPGSYEHYYFNVVRPNGLPYGTGFYQGNHYPAHHPQYAWHDQACRQHNCYHGHGGVRYSEIPAGNHLPASHCLDPQTGQVRNGARPLHPSAAEQPWSSMDGNSDIKDVRRVNGIAERRHDGAAAADTPLVVLSNCVDMVARNSADKPAPGWATAAAARRAHRARVIRERKRGVQNGKHGDNVADAKGKENAVADNRTRDAMGQKNDGIGRSEKDSAMPPNRSNQEEHRRERHADVLISPADGCNEAGVVDVGSDEAVAGFSGSDRQESGSDGATGGSTGGSRTPENSEEDPNSSNDGSGDDGRRNTRGSSPADPTSSGSREDTPSAPETVGPQNLSSANGTPPASRETTPSDNADAAAADGAGGGGGSSKGRNGTEKNASSDGGAAKMTRSPKAKRNASNSANDTIMVAAKMLSNYTADNNRNGGGGGGGVGNGVPVGKNPKSQIGNLLNCEPCASFRMEAAGGHQDQKRNRSAQDRACEEERVAGGPGYEGVEEPNSQRRKHSVSQVVGNINK